MPKIIQFNREKALNKATLLFWEQGYKNTSLHDLLKATGLGQGSFYNTFKSKRELYIQCMNHYNEVITMPRLKAFLKAPTAKQGIKDYFSLVIAGFENEDQPKGCLMANSLYADVLHDKHLKKYLVDGFAMFEDIFTRRFEEAKQDGELPPSFKSQHVAELIVVFTQGLFRVSLALKTAKQCQLQTRRFLESVELT